MKISRMANVIEPSLTRKLFNMAKQYDNVIDLTLGDPDVQPNEQIKKAACKAIMDGKTRYSANAGLPELRKAIAGCIEKEHKTPIDYEKNIIVTVGGMEALFLTFATNLLITLIPHLSILFSYMHKKALRLTPQRLILFTV